MNLIQTGKRVKTKTEDDGRIKKHAVNEATNMMSNLQGGIAV